MINAFPLCHFDIRLKAKTETQQAGFASAYSFKTINSLISLSIFSSDQIRTTSTNRRFEIKPKNVVGQFFGFWEDLACYSPFISQLKFFIFQIFRTRLVFPLIKKTKFLPTLSLSLLRSFSYLFRFSQLFLKFLSQTSFFPSNIFNDKNVF